MHSLTPRKVHLSLFMPISHWMSPNWLQRSACVMVGVLPKFDASQEFSGRPSSIRTDAAKDCLGWHHHTFTVTTSQPEIFLSCPWVIFICKWGKKEWSFGAAEEATAINLFHSESYTLCQMGIYLFYWDVFLLSAVSETNQVGSRELLRDVMLFIHFRDELLYSVLLDIIQTRAW